METKNPAERKPQRQRVASVGQRGIRGIIIEIRKLLATAELTVEQRMDLLKQASEWRRQLDRMPRESKRGKAQSPSKPSLFA